MSVVPTKTIPQFENAKATSIHLCGNGHVHVGIESHGISVLATGRADLPCEEHQKSGCRRKRRAARKESCFSTGKPPELASWKSGFEENVDPHGPSMHPRITKEYQLFTRALRGFRIASAARGVFFAMLPSQGA
jgi:hypothetical protein